MNKDHTYKKDVVIGTWVAVGLFVVTALLTLVHFEQLTTRPEPVRDCFECKWVD